MLQLVYTSVAGAEWDGDLAALCEQASANNDRDEITGVLMFEEGNFLQVLEGPRTTVEDTFLRIVADPRHHGLRLLSRRLSNQREFGDWSMALQRTEVERRKILTKVAGLVAQQEAGKGEAFRQRFRV